MKTFNRVLCCALFGAFIPFSFLLRAVPIDSTITYQGRLLAEGLPANGNYDLRFTLHDVPAGGNPVTMPLIHNDLAVSNGLFNVSLNFGSAFNGEARWLEIGVRHATNHNGAFTALLPRQSITATPYALHAVNAHGVPWSGISGVPPAVTNAAEGNHFGQTWTGSHTNSGLEVRNGGFATGLKGRQGNGSGTSAAMVAGVWGDAADGYGVVGTSGFRGVWGYAVGNAENYGVVGYSSSPSGHGVYGKAGSVNGGIGVLGETVSQYGTGVRGEAQAMTGVGAGVSGRAFSPQGVGVFGFATNSSGANRGVQGVSQSPQGYGVYAENTAGGAALKAAGSGIIQSTADSVLFFPAWTFRPGRDSLWYYVTAEPYVDLEYPTIVVPPHPWSSYNDWYGVVPLTIPGQLYGQPIRIKEITVFFEITGLTAHIDETVLRAQGKNIHTDPTDRIGNGSYTVTLPNGGWKPANENDYFLNLWLVLRKTETSDGDGRFVFRGAKMRIAHN
jgi:hypothetical protein